MSLWDALRMNMMISYQELVRTFLRIGSNRSLLHIHCYEKVNARRDRKLILKDRAKLININLDEHKRFLRIEARYVSVQ